MFASVEYWDDKLFIVQLFDDINFLFKLCEKYNNSDNKALNKI